MGGCHTHWSGLVRQCIEKVRMPKGDEYFEQNSMMWVIKSRGTMRV
jgi:hypothetical protein